MREKMLNVLEALFAAEKQTLDAMKEERRAIKTKGSLVIRMRKPYMLFTEKIDDREYGIMRDREKIRRLARKRFLEKAVADGEICCRLLAETIRRLKSQQGRALFPEGWEQVPELQAARFSARELLWLSTAASSNQKEPEKLIYMTRAGISVRSKSERLIADKLAEYALPFRYEARYENYAHGESFVAYPDFTILRADGREVVWEHFGLMNDGEYAAKTVRKIIDYQRGGCSLARDLICTFEEDIKDPQALDQIIQRFLL